MTDKAQIITDLLRKELQNTLDLMLSRNVGVEKYWEYLGKIIISKQILGRVGKKVIIRVDVFDEI